MKITKNVEMLEIAMPQSGDKMHPVLVWDEKDLILFDTGLPGQLELIRSEVAKTGHRLEDITKIILTHHDVDHIGNAKLIAKFGAKIMASKMETPYIQGDLTSPKIEKMKERMETLSPEEKMFFDRMFATFPELYVHVDEQVRNNEVLPYCGGIEVVPTPGHTPGHTAYFLKESKVLIAGDAANIADGKLTGPSKRNSLDMQEAEKSFENLKKLDYDFIVCYHGGLFARE